MLRFQLFYFKNQAQRNELIFFEQYQNLNTAETKKFSAASIANTTGIPELISAFSTEFIPANARFFVQSNFK